MPVIMDVASIGALKSASLLWQPRAGVFALTVVAKATYDLAPVESPLAPEQDPILEDDLAPLKLAADIALVGHAFAPGGGLVRSLFARLIVGDVDKTIEVYCDRLFTQQGVLQEGPWFTRMPLGYERAAGGPDTPNPVGVRRDARDRYGRLILPNLQPPGKLVTTPDDFIDTIGFGPLAGAWPVRRDKLGRHRDTWSPRALEREPLPEDIDRSYFNVAPLDQRVAELRDNERITLDNLHPDHPHLVTSLPGIHPRAIVTGRSSGPQELPLRADTLIIDTDRLVCTMTWRGQLSLPRRDEPGRVIIAVERAGQRLALEDILMAAGRRAGGEGSITVMIEPGAQRAETSPRPALPFNVSRASGSSPPPVPARPPPPPPRLQKPPPPPPQAGARSLQELGDMTLTLDGDKPLPEISPFQPSTPAAPATPASPAASASPASPAAPALVMQPLPASPKEAASPWAGGAPRPLDLPPAPAIAPTQPALDGPAKGGGQTIGALLVASNAAADPAAPAAPFVAPAEVVKAAAPAKSASGRDVLVLLWFDKKAMPRIERKAAWRHILDALEDRPIDLEVDDPALSDEPAEIEQRTHVFEILDRGAAIDVEGLYGLLARATEKRGKLVPPLELVDGDVVLPFDEVETLKAVVSTATPLATGDEALSAALATAEKFLGSPGVRSAPQVAEGLTARIREVFRQSKLHMPADTIDAQVERALLEERHYQKRRVLGGVQLRALLFMEGPNRPPVVAYLPEAMAEDLPLSARFRARFIAEVHLGVDEREMQPLALKAAALGRVVMLPGR